jgi:phytoene synthase
MVNNRSTSIEQAAAERRMILSYASPNGRPGLAALLALDDRLGAILRSTREPIVGQMRLTWWHDALTALDISPAPAEPVLQALADAVVPRVPGSALAEMVEGWEELFDPDPLDDERLARYAARRGAGLFVAAGAVLGASSDDPLALAGRGWALADLAAHVGDGRTQERAAELAVRALDSATAGGWSRPARPLGAMTHLARMPGRGAGARVGRALLHRLTGR